MRTILALALAVALLPLGAAVECVPTTSTTGTRQQVIGPVLTFYLANDACQPDCVFSMWFYQETNEIPGLQRHDERFDDTCGGQIESDTIVT